MNCRYCGTELPAEAMFCGECGRAVAIAPMPVASPPAAPPAAPAAPVAAPVSAPIVFSSAADASDDPVDHIGPAHPAPVCPQCGVVVEDEEVFCGECGFVLRSVPPVAGIAEAPEPPEPGTVVEPAVFAEPESPAFAEPESPTFAEPDLNATDVVPALEPDLELSLERAPRPDPAPWGSLRDDVEDLEATRLTVDPLADQRYVLQFSTGENVTIAGAGLIGRNPVAQPGEYVDQLIAVFDPTKSVSKTHLEFGQEAGRFWVSDRFSTNGSVVRQPDAEPRRCEPGRRYFVARGTRIDIGEQFFVVS